MAESDTVSVEIDLGGEDYIELERRAAVQDEETSTVASDLLATRLRNSDGEEGAAFLRSALVANAFSFWVVAAVWMLHSLDVPHLPPVPVSVTEVLPLAALFSVVVLTIALIAHVVGLPTLGGPPPRRPL